MSQNKRHIYFPSVILLAVVSLSMIIIMLAFLYEYNVYELLILLIPISYFMFYYIKKLKHCFVLPKFKKLSVDRLGMRSDDYIFRSNKNTDTGLKVLFGNDHCSQPYLSSIICNEVIATDMDDDSLLNNISVSDDKSFFMGSDEIIENNNEFKADGIW
ncbi:MAG: hypothetical protein ABI405_05695, partial [Parafilimonas sp.]